MPLRLAVRDISFFERPVPFTKPFRFGAVVINTAVQAFVRVEIEVEGKGTSVGASAELMAPKWFDKRPHLAPEQTVAELRRSLLIARDLYLSHSGFETAFGLHARRLAAQIASIDAAAAGPSHRSPPPSEESETSGRSPRRLGKQDFRRSCGSLPASNAGRRADAATL